MYFCRKILLQHLLSFVIKKPSTNIVLFWVERLKFDQIRKLNSFKTVIFIALTFSYNSWKLFGGALSFFFAFLDLPV